MPVLLDTGFVYAVLNRNEQYHVVSTEIAREARDTMLLPTPVIVEVAYLLLRDIGPIAVAEFLEGLASTDLVLIEPEDSDYQRAAAVLRQYNDAHIDLVDSLIVAIAERLNIRLILTLDQRHFRMFRPQHCTAFELLP
ncbi:MAG: PIN domain-containing protein [Caldilineae bacterium]|nr:PIN domain-containing protein [Anaerolineae bacterium]MCB0252459.1 PIN domain-containing protein [Anaerolineae bacterium]MCB9154871.1 PIN domain-containing protein [Caldilineae bacterium]